MSGAEEFVEKLQSCCENGIIDVSMASLQGYFLLHKVDVSAALGK